MKTIKYIITLFFLLKMIGLNAQIYVDASATGLNNGTSWTDAFANLKTAITSAGAGSELWIAAGTYSPGAARTHFFHISNDIELYGGFNGTETIRSQRDFQTNLTIISGDVLGNDVGVILQQTEQIVTMMIGLELGAMTY